MKPGLTLGHSAELAWTVSAEQAIALGGAAGGAVVFSSPAMINLMEHAARAALAEFLEIGEESVGARIGIEHLAATPIGASVRAVARVAGIDGKLIDFEIAAFDPLDQIGRGTHRRAAIQIGRFAERLAEKTHRLPPGALPDMSLAPNPGELPPLDTLLVEIDGPLATITLNRPKQRNAVDTRMTADWERLISWLAGHAEVRAAIVTGAGPAFCGGDDLKEVATLEPDAARQLSWRQARAYLAFEQLPQVVIAAVNGFALGAGCVCACACDFRIAAHAARFGMPEVLIGWPPGYGLAQLTALIGKARALQLCLTGEQVSAHTAVEFGLAHEVVPLSRLLPRARELARHLIALPAEAIRETKRLIHTDEGLRPKTTYLADTEAYLRCLGTADAREGLAAFAEKRPRRYPAGKRS